MIGAILYRLRAEAPARLPSFHGRLMHGLMFHLLQEHSAELATFLHDELDYKPFTVSLLQESAGQAYGMEVRRGRDHRELPFCVKEGHTYFWRVTALHEGLLQFLL